MVFVLIKVPAVCKGYQQVSIVSTSKERINTCTDPEPPPPTHTPPWKITSSIAPGRVAQSVTCLATDGSLPADPGVASSILARSHTFVEIDREIFSTVILLPSAESFKKGCYELQAKVCARSTG